MGASESKEASSSISSSSNDKEGLLLFLSQNAPAAAGLATTHNNNNTKKKKKNIPNEKDSSCCVLSIEEVSSQLKNNAAAVAVASKEDDCVFEQIINNDESDVYVNRTSAWLQTPVERQQQKQAQNHDHSRRKNKRKYFEVEWIPDRQNMNDVVQIESPSVAEEEDEEEEDNDSTFSLTHSDGDEKQKRYKRDNDSEKEENEDSEEEYLEEEEEGSFSACQRRSRQASMRCSARQPLAAFKAKQIPQQLQPQSKSSHHKLQKWSVSLQPLLLAIRDALDHSCNFKDGTWPESVVDIVAGSGCLLRFAVPDYVMAQKGTKFWSRNDDALRKHIQQGLDLEHALLQFLLEPVDSMDEITECISFFESYCMISRDINTNKANNRDDSSARSVNEACYGAAEDILWWQKPHGTIPLKDLTKLRRILLPLTLYVTDQNGQHVLCVRPLDWSLADLMIGENYHDKSSKSNKKMAKQQEKLRDQTIRALLRSLQFLKQANPAETAPVDDIPQYVEIQELLVTTCRRAGGRFTFEGKHLELGRLAMLQDIPLPLQSSQNMRRIYSIDRAGDHLDVKKKRNDMLQKHYQQKDDTCSRGSNRKQQLVVYGTNGLGEKEFLEETSFMHDVNGTFARQFDLVESRPRLCQAQLTADELRKIRNLLFAPDGSLSQAARDDASTWTAQTHLIAFFNDARAGKNDKRWQIQLKTSAALEVAPVRSAVEDVLFSSGILDKRHENISEIFVLIGGTHDQSIHHDLPRDWVSWKQSPSHEAETVGWEIDRLKYNQAMISKHAPAGILLPLALSPSTKATVETETAPSGDDDNAFVMIGVQKDQIRKSTDKADHCFVRWGDPCEQFQIVRETEHLVVLKIPNGCMFTGDFPHAGVCNIATQEEKALLQAFYIKVDRILAQHEYDDHERGETNAVLDLCTHTPGLNNLCRLYITTTGKDSVFHFPSNSIGCYRCYSNRPLNDLLSGSDPDAFNF